jgi:maleate isomerase
VREQRGLGLHGRDITLVPLDRIYRLARQVDTPDSDGVYIACTGFRSLEIIEDLERDLGKPVISANQATMWDALRLAGVQVHEAGLGRLYRMTEEAGLAAGIGMATRTLAKELG